MGNLNIVPLDLLSGVTIRGLSVTSPDQIFTVRLLKETRLISPEGRPVGTINAHWNLNPPPAPSGTEIVLAMDLRPKGTEVMPEAELVMKYSSLKLPSGTSERDLFMVELEGSTWEEVPSKLDIVAKTVTANLDSLTMYALMVRVTSPSPVPAPAPATAPPSTNWAIIGGVIMGVIIIAGLAISLWRRRELPGK